MQPHPLDPPAPFRATNAFGRLVAAGLLSYPESLAALVNAALASAADAQHPPSGTRARLAHALTDAIADWTIRRARATRAIRAALAPHIAARAPARQLLAAATEENRAHGSPLRQIEILQIARAEAGKHLARA